MTFSLSLRQDQFDTITDAFLAGQGNERAAYVLCSKAATDREMRFVALEVIIVPDQDIESSSPIHISIRSRSYVKAIARADRLGLHFFLVHNHPTGYSQFSEQDDVEEAALFNTAFVRAPTGPHGSIVFVGNENPHVFGRVWVNDTEHEALTRVRVIGNRLRLFDQTEAADEIIPPWADRQVRVFGPEFQRSVSKLHVGVVGVGGTGSCVCEQLIRLGVGEITVIDEQDMSETNVARLYGSSHDDVGLPKSDIAKRHSARINVGTTLNAIKGSVSDRDTAKILRNCDVIFGCTDDSLGRSILGRLAHYYYIPVIDMAVSIDSTDGIIRGVFGRVTLLYPGATCLRCRGRISTEQMTAEVLRRSRPDEYAQRVREGYIPELNVPDPSVIMFTTSVAARGVTEFVQMVTGFMGNDRTTTEVQELFHDTFLGKNSRPGIAGCLCQSPEKWGKADQAHLLGLIW